MKASLYGHWVELGGYQREEIHRGAAQAMAAHFAIKCEGLSIWTLEELGGYQREEIYRESALAMAAHFALKCEGLSIWTLGRAGGLPERRNT